MIAVYASDYYSSPYTTVYKEFYSAKDGCATKRNVDSGLENVMECGYFDQMEWVDSIGCVLLHPMEFTAEVIRRAREGDSLSQEAADEMKIDYTPT